MPRRDQSDQILASVLFTDIVGSTETAARLGDRGFKHLLAKHHAVMRKELKRFRGKEMDTAGDGFFAAFDQPADAIRCAVAVSERLAPLDVHIRAGVHMGQVEVDGPKVQGIAVNIGARVMAKAQGDEVLVSSTVRDALAGADLEFEDRGTFELKGVPGEWHLFAVERSAALVARALGNEPVESPADGGAAHPWYRQRGALVAIAAVALIAVLAGILLSRGGTPAFEPKVNTVIALDPSDVSVVTGASVEAVPLGVGADDTTVWVANSGSGNVTKIDPSGEADPITLSVDPTPGSPEAVAVGDGTAWVAVGGPNGAAVNQFAANTSTPKGYDMVAGVAGIAYGDGIVWVANNYNGNLYRLDPATGGAAQRFPLQAGGGLEGVAVGGGYVWVADGLQNKALLRVDPATGDVKPIDLPGDPRGVAFEGDSVWVTIPDLDKVMRIDASTFQQVTVDAVGDGPREIAVADGEAWVTCLNSRTVVGIDTTSNQIDKRFSLDEGLAPQGIALGGDYVWVTVAAP